MWLGLGLALIVIVTAVAALPTFGLGAQGLAAIGGGQRVPATSYRRIDDNTIAILVVTGERTWTRVTEIIETESDITVAIRSLTFPGIQTSVGHFIEVTAELRSPLAERTISDGFGEIPHDQAPP